MAKVERYEGIDGLKADLRALDREATAQLRDEAQALAGDIADQARARGQGVSRLYAVHVAPTIRARRDRVPVVALGGSKSPAGDVLWGAEYGGGARPTTRQFLPHLGRTGYALWPAIRDADITKRYSEALDRALDRSLNGGTL